MEGVSSLIIAHPYNHPTNSWQVAAGMGRDRPITVGTSPDFSPEGKMIAQRFVFTRGFLTERNTDCLCEGRKSLVGTKIKRGLVILVRNAG